MTRILDPVDICWLNMGAPRGFVYFRRGFIYLAIVSIFIFLTTPTVIYRVIARANDHDFLR